MKNQFEMFSETTAKLNQTLLEMSLVSALSELCLAAAPPTKKAVVSICLTVVLFQKAFIQIHPYWIWLVFWWSTFKIVSHIHVTQCQ